MTEFPLIHTNIWDAVWAIPVIIILTQIFKKYFHIPSMYVPSVVSFLGLAISILISHRHDFSAGVFMGFFYSAAAIGTYASLKNSFRTYRTKANSS